MLKTSLDEMNPIYCIRCKAMVSSLASEAGKGLCPACLTASPSPTIVQAPRKPNRLFAYRGLAALLAFSMIGVLLVLKKSSHPPASEMHRSTNPSLVGSHIPITSPPAIQNAPSPVASNDSSLLRQSSMSRPIDAEIKRLQEENAKLQVESDTLKSDYQTAISYSNVLRNSAQLRQAEHPDRTPEQNDYTVSEYLRKASDIAGQSANVTAKMIRNLERIEELKNSALR